MGKIKKAGKEGAAAKYINRNRAIKKLQISLPNFRRLCILKGIYPVEPKNRKKINKGSSAPTTFYYVKDIKYLMHEPLLDKLRQHKIFKRKLRRAVRKSEWTKAKILKDNKPTYNLDHLIIERYPTFVDALRDLDDAISLISLFSIMPSSKKAGNGVISQCKKLYYEFLHYIIQTNSLSKAFLSIKGIYYQATIRGQKITWIAPYEFSQKIPRDVDFRVMWSFLEFYRNLLGFVNFKLYKDEKLTYPPTINVELENIGASLGSLTITSVGRVELLNNLLKLDDQQITPTLPEKNDAQKISKLSDLAKKISAIASEQDSALDPNSETPEQSEQVDYANNDENDDSETIKGNNLFKNFTFYLSREVPRYSLEFVIRSAGGKVCWDSYFNGESQPNVTEIDKRINIYVVDRPVASKRISSTKKTLVQPQFIYDCINANVILSFNDYAVGKKLPPHLSPFVEYKEGDYVPKQQLAIEEYAKNLGFKGEIETLEANVENNETSTESTEIKSKKGSKAKKPENDNDSGSDYDTELDEMSADESESEAESDKGSDYDSELEDLMVNLDDDLDNSYESELKTEFEGEQYSTSTDSKKRKASTKPSKNSQVNKEEEERKKLAMTVMSKKNRKLYARMQRGIENRKKHADMLNDRRIEAEKVSAKSLKQKSKKK
ncbi:hypothetical protein BB561_000502 [Smittium simulii]|uniref:Pescadillo homolog n=1 Tax=Smittium simulii TaxID=133385 RepID=A0A2T9YYS6_9FUNG|nr:hypothetical protein BB561_000502 [Smittium simulii]